MPFDVVAALGAVTGAFVTTFAGLAEGEFNGAPTAISHRWPGFPCAGFAAVLFGSIATAGDELVTAGWLRTGCITGVVKAGNAGFLGKLTRGWPETADAGRLV